MNEKKTKKKHMFFRDEIEGPLQVITFSNFLEKFEIIANFFKKKNEENLFQK